MPRGSLDNRRGRDSMLGMKAPASARSDFTTPDGDELFMVSAWLYQDLVVHGDGLQLLPASTDATVPLL